MTFIATQCTKCFQYNCQCHYNIPYLNNFQTDQQLIDEIIKRNLVDKDKFLRLIDECKVNILEKQIKQLKLDLENLLRNQNE